MAEEYSKGSLSLKSATCVAGGSLIRRMFTAGIEMKKKYGEDNVFDFSLGNPGLEPPPEFQKALEKIVKDPPPLGHGYMPQQGYPFTRAAMAKLSSKLQGLDISADQIVMTSGAAGGLNVVLNTICDPGDEIIVIAPFFPEYKFYAQNANSTHVVVQCDKNFDPDIAAIKAAITNRTRAVIFNSPNNPTGRCYRQERVNELGKLLADEGDKRGRPIYLLSDEPYIRLIYSTDVPPHSTFKAHKYSIVCGSFSKDISIPGERLGFLAVNSEIPQMQELYLALCFWNRTLGFVNANALMQRVLAECADACVDISWYDERRKLMVQGLRDAGLEIVEPEGAFYAFPKVPEGVETGKFVEALQNRHVLTVPGAAFGLPGYIRLCYAVKKTETITRACAIIKEVVAELKK